MAVIRCDVSVDVSSAIPASVDGPVTVAATVVVDPSLLAGEPVVVMAVPGGTYHRRYWDLQPPGRPGYSQAQWMVERGAVFIAVDYLGGGDSSRPADGDFMTLEVAADAAHAAFESLRGQLETGGIDGRFPPLEGATYVGFGQSLGGFITMIQQGTYGDYAGVAILGASPIRIANIPHTRDVDGVAPEERRRMILEDSAKRSGVAELPMYHGMPRDVARPIFHVADLPDDLYRYDEEECHTLISRISGVDGMTPGYALPFARAITSPVFTGWGDVDVSNDPHAEPSAYTSSSHVTLAIVERMAHMHNFAATREQLWEHLQHWLPVVQRRVDGPSPARRFAQRYVDIINRGAYDELASLFAADAIFLAPNREVLHGAEAIGAFYQRFLEELTPTIRISSFVQQGHDCVFELEADLPGSREEFFLGAIDHATVGPDGKVVRMAVFTK